MSGGPFERHGVPLSAQGSWKGLRVDSGQGERALEDLKPAAELSAPEPSPIAETNMSLASKAAASAAGAAEGQGAPSPPLPTAGQQAPGGADADADWPPPEGTESPVLTSQGDQPLDMFEGEQPEGEQQELAALQNVAVAPAAMEPDYAEPTEPPEPATAAPPTDTVAAQDAPPSTASSTEGEQGTPTSGAQRVGRTSLTGGPRGPLRRLPKAATQSGEGAPGGDAAEPLAGSEGQQATGGILAELEAHRQQHKQLVVEGRVRQELESMLQRIEGHFRTEQAARRRTEEALAVAAGERDALRGQLEAERMQQAALLQQAMQERGMLEAQLAAISAELEQTRQEWAARLEAMTAEAAAWRASAEGVAHQAEQARRELAEQAAEIEGTSVKIRSLAQLLTTPGSPTAPSGACLACPAGSSPGAGHQAALMFHRNTNASSGGGSSGKAKSRLPHLSTRAIPGAALRQPGGEGSSPGGSPSISALPSLSPGTHGLLRERSTGGGVAWAASGKPVDRSTESQRDHARTAHMARWNA